MAHRFTNTDKWKDPWFRGLNPNEKLLFLYLCDNCDLGGFYEVDIHMISFITKLAEDEIIQAFKGLKRGYLGADGWIWIINFLKHQKNLPLNIENNAHKHIINLIEVQKNRFPNILETVGPIKGLTSPIGKGKDKGKVKVKVNNADPQKNLEQDCEPYKDKYDAKLIEAFVRHWTEKNKYGKEKWQLEATWETGKRLATWYENSAKWDKNVKPDEKSNVYKGNFFNKKKQ